MAYQTGTGNTIADFVDALKNFASAQGWTVSRYDTVGRFLNLEKGIVHAAFYWRTDVTKDAYLTANSSQYTSISDHSLYGVLGNAALINNRDSNTWWDQPGNKGQYSAFVNNGWNDYYALVVNNLTGPFTSWHFFSDAGGNYIQAVVQTGELFTHLFFGMADKGTLTHSGAAFLTGTWNYWWPTHYLTDASSLANQYYYNRMQYLRAYPAGGPGSQFDNLGNFGGQFFVPNALPAGFPTMGSMRDNVVAPMSFRDKPTATLQDLTHPLSHIIMCPAPTWSGYVPMFGVPLIIANNLKDRICCVGFYPNFRLLNMEGMSPGQEINLNGDIWKVFPLKCQRQWADTGMGRWNTSGHYAVAYKKIA